MSYHLGARSACKKAPLKLFTRIIASRLAAHATSANLIPKLQRAFCGYDGASDCNFLLDAIRDDARRANKHLYGSTSFGLTSKTPSEAWIMSCFKTSWRSPNYRNCLKAGGGHVQ